MIINESKKEQYDHKQLAHVMLKPRVTTEGFGDFNNQDKPDMLWESEHCINAHTTIVL